MAKQNERVIWWFLKNNKGYIGVVTVNNGKT